MSEPADSFTALAKTLRAIRLSQPKVTIGQAQAQAARAVLARQKRQKLDFMAKGFQTLERDGSLQFFPSKIDISETVRRQRKAHELNNRVTRLRVELQRAEKELHDLCPDTNELLALLA